MSVMGTPRTIGETMGQRLKPRLQVLTQYLTEQLAAGLAGEGRTRMDRAALRKALAPSVEATTRLEPGVWMELESMARAAELPPEDLLLAHGYGDLVSFFHSSLPPSRSTFVSLNAVHTDHGLPRLILAWHLDPALLPYVTLVRRTPAHGPASLTLTLAGLHPIVGISEAGLAVAANELRVEDGAPGLMTHHLLAAALTAPSREDAERRVLTGQRHGGACIHLLDAAGERASLELSGRQAVRLPDPWPQSPRVHCNLALSDEVLGVASKATDLTSKARLEQIAALAVDARACSPAEIADWFGLSHFSQPRGGTSRVEGIRPDSTVLMICDPSLKAIHLLRGGSSQGMGYASL